MDSVASTVSSFEMPNVLASWYRPLIAPGVDDGFATVSYTHLDVYKRQGQMEQVRRGQRRVHRIELRDAERAGILVQAVDRARRGRRIRDCLLYTSRCV
ncbi:hypothetical protein [Burkholderia plantarii]|uniref:hypothetical protein n=1 Tax=Burkholderia plantarii TaxID=41899 RepID=UPI00114CED07|nr:hypothetical protein [Burkholderia plantarii]